MTRFNTQLPRHIAIIMDGNGRWAKARHLPRVAGHRAGVKTAAKIIEYCAKLNIEVLSLFAFSSENWSRPNTEVSALMGLFMQALTKEVAKLNKQNIRLQFIGAKDRFEPALAGEMQAAEELTANNTGLRLVVAMNYGGRWDIIQAVQSLLQHKVSGDETADTITEQDISRHLATAELPEPDLFIRTSGEQRISNFFLWQLAYTELYFTDTLWPAFDEQALQQALDHYTARERRFGGLVEQQGE